MAVGPLRFTGAILCGGQSRRMGRDKALIPIGGTPMIVRVADALRRAGATDVAGIGREPDALASLGLVCIPDARPGAGPAAGIATALAWAGRDGDDGRDRGDIALVVGCDLLAPSPTAMVATVAALAQQPPAAVAVPVSDGRSQWHHAAWHRSSGPALGAALDAGARAVGQVVAAAGLVVARVDGIDPAALVDADTPQDLPSRADDVDDGAR